MGCCCEEAWECLHPVLAREALAEWLFVCLVQGGKVFDDLVAVFDAHAEIVLDCAVGCCFFEFGEFLAHRFEAALELCFDMVAEPDAVRENSCALFAVNVESHIFEPLFKVCEVEKCGVNHSIPLEVELFKFCSPRLVLLRGSSQ